MTPTRRTPGSKPPGSTQTNGSGPGDGDGGGLAGILNLGNQVMADSRANVASTRRRTAARLDEIVEEGIKDGAQDRATVQARITGSTFESVKVQAERDERDFAGSMEALQQVTEGMDQQFKALVEPSAEELALVQNAKNKHAKTKQALESKKASWFNPFGIRDRAAAELERQLELDQQGIAAAEVDMASRVRQRLMDATMEKSVDAFVSLSNKTVQIMTVRVEELQVQIGILDERRTVALREKELAAKQMEKLTADLEKNEAALETEQATLSTFANGTPDYSAQEKVISNLVAQVEQIRSDREVALTYFQSKERNLKLLELEHITAIKLQGRHKARIARLKSDTEERAKMYPASLVNMQTIADQKFDGLIKKIGITTDRNMSERSAAAIVAADNALMEDLEEQPGLLRENEVICEALRKHFKRTRDRADTMLTMMSEGYEGVNTGSSLFSAPPPPSGDGNPPPGGGNEKP